MKFLFLFLFPLILCVVVPTRAQLDPFFYKDTCPSLQSTVRQVLLNVSKGPGKDKRLFASLIRLHFHDCFVQGCDGSILLNDTAFIKSEQLAAPNLNSIRRLDVINLIKENIEEACPGVVSCADIVALAAEVSSEMSNGPTWQVPLGRRDSETASFDLANSDIPGPSSNLPQLISAFQKKGLDMNDLVALSGAHTIGRGRCTLSRRRNCKNDGHPPPIPTPIRCSCNYARTPSGSGASKIAIIPSKLRCSALPWPLLEASIRCTISGHESRKLKERALNFRCGSIYPK
ncbi:hypothetical protein Ahy_Scaffold6g107823 [Arachis hypogaea]|uniref:Peroxidase n=1 Tax=Arachis hypogaea TaxID=3818 RepID=A0A444WNP4_ARAHY|nr:hypothetical protein Ahy_Scaffold6g107823 [Arachis hypogaea]